MEKNSFTPSISKTAFSCPHCGAYASQTWFRIFLTPYRGNDRTPTIAHADVISNIEELPEASQGTKTKLTAWATKMLSERPFINQEEKDIYLNQLLYNCNVSKCFNCGELTVWIHKKIAYPVNGFKIQADKNMPQHIKQLFDEAGQIVDFSPKGAAALLRLCVQYLCKELGESGKNIDTDIANLVSKGLNPLIQKSLDIVRVIGNESVHPGEINLDDNREIAMKLFELVNLVCHQMITIPKEIGDIYNGLPDKKLKAIEKRNQKAISTT